jgi:hypothetical protein
MRHVRSVLTCILVATLAGLALAIPASAETKFTPSFGVDCPEATTPGRTVLCYVHVQSFVQGGNLPWPTGTVSFSVPSFKGVISPTTCVLDQGACTIAYTPKGTGTSWRRDTISATYSGDSVWYSQRTSTVIAVPAELPVSFHVYCDPGSVVPGYTTHCSVSVLPGTAHLPSPTGTVSFTVPAAKGTVTPTCVLVDMHCAIAYTPTGVGSGWRKDTITATYSGDAEWGQSTTTAVVAVPTRQPPYLATWCDQVSTTPGVAASCLVAFGPTVDGPAPTGVVTLTVPSTAGTVTPSTCPVSAPTGSCQYTYTPKGVGSGTRKDTVTATYPGDSFWAPATSKVVIEVPAS